MVRKDVTPTNNNGFMKKFGMGLLGGVIGGSLALGGFYAVSTTLLNNPSHSITQTNSANKKDTKVSNVNYNVNSDITKAIDKVKDSVVSVVNMQTQKQGMDIFGSSRSDNNSDSNEPQATGEGSGVIYKKDGKTAYIVTNNHVVENAEELSIILHDGTKVKGELIGTDSYTDLAVIKISSDKVTEVAQFGNSENIKIGEPALAIGSPLGSDYANSVTQGIVSSLNRNITNQNESGETININAIQTDAAINPGNSGGPLINVEGQVIGINSVKILQSNSQVSVEGMGFAIPSNDVVDIINQLEKNKKVARPGLGITMSPLSDVSDKQKEQVLKVPDSVKDGVIVLSAQPATPAEKAGLEKYDVITKIDGKEVTSATDLQRALYKKKIGDKMEVTFYRGSKEKKVTIELNLDKSALKQPNKQQNDRDE